MAYIVEKTISQTYLSRCQRSPKKVGFVYKLAAAGEQWQRVTYEEHFNLCQEVAAGLRSLGVQAKDKVAILSNTRFEWQLTDMAILGAQAITVPVYASLTAAEVEYILNHSDSKVLVLEDQSQIKKIQSLKPGALSQLETIVLISETESGKNGQQSLPETLLGKKILHYSQLRELGRSWLASQPGGIEKSKFLENNLKAAQPEDLITICYTSGTTGVPKGAMLSQDNMMAIIEAAIELLGDIIAGEGIVGLSFLPFSHVIGKVESMLCYAICEELWFAESIEKMGVNMQTVKPQLLFGVPRIFEKAHTKILAKLGNQPAHKQKIFQLALLAGRRYHQKIWNGQRPNLAETLAFRLADRTVFKVIRDAFGGNLRFSLCGGAPFAREIGEFFHIAGVRVCEGYGLTETCAPVTLNPPHQPKFGTVGPLLPGVEVRIADEDGEILLKGRQIFQGYYKNQDATNEVMHQGWFRTGDIGHLDEHGYLKITDRKKDLLVTSGGKNVAPQKIENLAKTHAIISQFVVHGDKRKYLTALITLDPEQIKRYAKTQNIRYESYVELLSRKEVLALVQSVINEINAQLPSFESIKQFTLIPEDFSVESGELTPSLKVKRKYVNQKYSQQFDAMYGGHA